MAMEFPLMSGTRTPGTPNQRFRKISEIHRRRLAMAQTLCKPGPLYERSAERGEAVDTNSGQRDPQDCRSSHRPAIPRPLD